MFVFILSSSMFYHNHLVHVSVFHVNIRVLVWQSNITTHSNVIAAMKTYDNKADLILFDCDMVCWQSPAASSRGLASHVSLQRQHHLGDHRTQRSCVTAHTWRCWSHGPRHAHNHLATIQDIIAQFTSKFINRNMHFLSKRSLRTRM